MRQKHIHSHPAGDKYKEELVNAEHGMRGDTMGIPAKITFVIALCWSLFQMATASVLLLDSVYVKSIHLAFAISLVYLNIPLIKPTFNSRWDLRILLAMNRVTVMDYILGIMAAVAGIDEDPSDRAAGIFTRHQRIDDVPQSSRRDVIDLFRTVAGGRRQLDRHPVEKGVLPVRVEFERVPLPPQKAMLLTRDRRIFAQASVGLGCRPAAGQQAEQQQERQKNSETRVHFYEKILPSR